MPRPQSPVSLLLFALLAANACRAAPRPVRSSRTLGYAPLLATIDREDAEARYHAVLRLGRHDSSVVRGRLRSLLTSEEPLTRNAAARALISLGERDAAAALVANLHRDQRTYVTMDAIHHLRTVYGDDLGYDANGGYRHQTEILEAWCVFLEARGHERPPLPSVPDEHAETRADLIERIDGYEAHGDSDPPTWEDTKTLWQALTAIAPSRNPDDVAVVARGFGALARCFPEQVDLSNNHALASLNDDRATDALEAYGRALALTPDDAQLHNDVGILYESMRQGVKAKAHYRRATELAPEDDVPWANLGDVRAHLGLTADAIAAYREAERLAPEKWYYHRLWIRRLGSR